MSNYKRFKWDYDYSEDILFIYKQNQISKETIEIQDDFHIDIDKDNNIVAIEIWKATKFFKNLGIEFENLRISKKIFKQIEDVRIAFKIHKNIIGLKMVLLINNEEFTNNIGINVYETASPLLQTLKT